MCGGRRLTSDSLFHPFPTYLLEKPPTEPGVTHLTKLAELRATGLHPQCCGCRQLLPH